MRLPSIPPTRPPPLFPPCPVQVLLASKHPQSGGGYTPLTFTFKRAKGTLLTLPVSKKTWEGPAAMCAKDHAVLAL